MKKYYRICRICNNNFKSSGVRGGYRICEDCKNKEIVCACGCGIKLKAYQNYRYKEVRYIRGHNGILNRGKKKNLSEDVKRESERKRKETVKLKKKENPYYGKREYTVICNICNVVFISYSGNRKYCDVCKEKKVFCACGCGGFTSLIPSGDIYSPNKKRFIQGHNSKFANSAIKKKEHVCIVCGEIFLNKAYLVKYCLDCKNKKVLCACGCGGYVDAFGYNGFDNNRYILGHNARQVNNIPKYNIFKYAVRRETLKHKKALYKDWGGLCYYTG